MNLSNGKEPGACCSGDLLVEEPSPLPLGGSLLDMETEPPDDEFLKLWRALRQVWAMRVAMELLDEFDTKGATSLTYEGDS